MDTVKIVCPHCRAVNRVVLEKIGRVPKCGKCKGKFFTARLTELDSDNFITHLTRNEIPVLVDFSADWCGPCKTMEPIFEQAAEALEPEVRLARVDAEMEKEIASRYGIQSIPTMILFKDGQEVAREFGAMDLNALLRWVRANI